ncbi:ribokinase [Allosaccharopolyspora coralli]|uniref:Ribokinase n=1 Tax=Allosaccharopolyspora coralli TaxID=2665642 RepID=A0A5Q3QB10_9PSEU|nr:PfkB family carbohydrate kinase [Allosaccharopolyspora coralli]QGK68799.1 ribokinase [Allosaccharopolyspora coralli]
MTAVFVGLATVDLVQRVERLPGPNEKVAALDAELLAGGPAAVAALTASVLGSESVLVTALGRHPFAASATAELHEHGVRVLDSADTGGVPPVSAVTVQSGTGERSVVSRSAAGRVSTPPDAFSEVVGGADLVLLDGHYPELALAAARLASSAGVPVLLDGGSWKPVLTDLLPLVDVAVCSEDFRAPGTDTPESQGPALLDRGVDAVAVTRGAAPVLCWSLRGEPEELSVPPVDAVDTLGAGDVFHGAVAHAMCQSAWRERLPEVIDFAGRVASARVAHRGRTSWIDALHTSADLVFLG